MCASPIGQAVYGWLFELLGTRVFVVFFGAALLTVALALGLKKGFGRLEEILGDSGEGDDTTGYKRG